ncbi:hypothetical protein ACU8V7_20870 [Zobellia nedashkovskayae]
MDKQTIGAVFNRAGYNTMRTCKKGNSYPGANEQFTVVHDAVKRGGTEETGSAWHSKQVLEYLGNVRKLKKKILFSFILDFPIHMIPGMALQSYWKNMER